MNSKFSFLLFGLLLISFWQCKSGSEGSVESNESLPYLGNWYADSTEVSGKMVMDTVYHEIADFSFINQMGDTISKSDVTGKVYVADFFFTSCPSICPVMQKNMLKLYKQYKDERDFAFLSYSMEIRIL